MNLSHYLDSVRNLKLPFWIHYSRGGNNFWGYPVVAGFHILTPILYFLSNIVAFKFLCVVTYLTGVIGAYLCAKEFKFGPLACVLFVSVCVLNSMFVLIMGTGMLSFAYYVTFPLLFWFWLRGSKRTIYIGIPIYIFSMVMMGAAHAITLVLLSFGIWFLYHLNKSNTPKIKAFIIGVVLGIGLGAVKLYPGVLYMKDAPREIGDIYSGFSLQGLVYSMIYPRQKLYRETSERYAKNDFKKIFPDGKGDFLRGINHWWDENGMFVGLVPIILFFIGLFNKDKFSRPILFFTLTFLLLSFGTRLPHGPWTYLNNFFPFDSIRFPMRFRAFFLFGFAYFSAAGFEYIFYKYNRKNLVKYLTLGLSVVPIICVSYYVTTFAFPFKSVMPARGDFVTVRKCPIRIEYMTTTQIGFYPCYLAGISTTYNDESEEVATVKTFVSPRDSKDYRGEVYYLDNTIENDISFQFVPNGINLFFPELKENTDIIVNQNYHDGWRFEDNRVFDYNGLIGVHAEKGQKSIFLHFVPDGFYLGLKISFLFGLLLLLSLWIVFRYQKGKASSSA